MEPQYIDSKPEPDTDKVIQCIPTDIWKIRCPAGDPAMVSGTCDGCQCDLTISKLTQERVRDEGFRTLCRTCWREWINTCREAGTYICLQEGDERDLCLATDMERRFRRAAMVN